MIGTLFRAGALAIAVCVAAQAFVTSAGARDAAVDGLWFTNPGLPENSETFSEEVNAENGNASVTYFIDDAMAVLVIERFAAEGGIETVADLVAEFEDIDRTRINVVTSFDDGAFGQDAAEAEPRFTGADAARLAEHYSYPVALAEFLTGENEDARKSFDLFIPTDAWMFRAHVTIAVDSLEDYEDQVLEWFTSMTLDD